MTQQHKILVIDDDVLVRQSIAIYLEDSGYLICEAEDGKQALELFTSFQPDLVICDLRMPEMDGLEVIKKLTKSSPNLPIIIVSGAGQIHDVVESLRLGAIDYLVKPITDMIVLENAIINALKRFQLEVENKTYRQELEHANKELEHHLQILQQDKDAGKRAQLQLLPEQNETINKYRFEHEIIPSQNLSGDFIDYFRITDNYIGFYIADVSGHGPAAAFLTMTLKSLINLPLRQYRSGSDDIIIKPARFMDYLNRELIKANIDKHITLFYGVIDCENNQLDYSVAGQYPAPVVVSGNTHTLLNEEGFPLGLFEWAKFESYQFQIAEDFKLLMLSDGWLELLSQNESAAKEVSLLDYIKQNEVSITSMRKPLDNYTKSNVPDDITIFLITKQ